MFHSNCTPNFSKDESHALHISIVRQKTGPGISSKLRSGDSSRFSCFWYTHAVILSSIEMYGAHALTYFLKFHIANMTIERFPSRGVPTSFVTSYKNTEKGKCHSSYKLCEL